MYRLSLVLVIRYLVCSSCLEDTRLVSRTGSKSVLSCPPWTYHKNNDADCLCGDSINGVVLCNRSQSPLYDIWCTSSDDTSPSVCLFTCHCMSYSAQFDTVIMGECPYLCTKYFYHNVPTRTEDLNGMCSKIVPQNRTGQLCGKCTEGYAPGAYSYGIQCADCTDYKYNWIKYVLIAYLPIILLFIVVTIFKLSATAPYMNAFICQMLSSSLYMTLLNGFAAGQSDNTDDVVTNLEVLTFLYGIWNLDFFRLSFKPLCLHPNISTIQVISLDYVIACCPLLLILLTYILVKIHDNFVMIQNIWKPMAWLLAWFNKGSIATSISLIKVFSTFFLLSYVKVLNTSLDLLMPVQAVNMTGHIMGTYSYYNSSLEYFGLEHRPYAILALLMFVLFNLMPLLLLCLYPCRCFQSCHNCCRLNSQVLRTFMDAFQGCYKIEPYDCRYFSTFFLVLRITGLLSFYFTKSWYFFSYKWCHSHTSYCFLGHCQTLQKGHIQYH